jgi:hypothetical protein
MSSRAVAAVAEQAEHVALLHAIVELDPEPLPGTLSESPSSVALMVPSPTARSSLPYAYQPALRRSSGALDASASGAGKMRQAPRQG